MSIAMERFGSYEQLSESRISSGLRDSAFRYRLQCRACGFEPVDAIIGPPRCPKCHGSAWERFAFSRSLLMNADRRADSSPALRSLFARADAI
jgi:hypothetical protein